MSAVTWVLELIDKVTGPVRRIVDSTDRLEQRIERLDRQTRSLSRSYDEAGRQGGRSADKVDKAYARAESRINRVKAAVLNTGKALVAVGGVAAGAAVKAALDGMSGREGNLQSLGTLLKTNNQKTIKDAAGWIGHFADITPFEDPAVMSAVKQLLASQFSFSDTKGIARITGDAASALGNDTADAQMKWEVINRALGQIKSKGRVQGDELLQLQEAGIGTNAYLEKYVGKNYQSLMQKGQLSASAGLNAILRGLNDDYGNSMNKMSATFSGLASTLASRPKRILSAMFDEGGLTQAKAFLSNLVDITDFSKPPGDKILKRLSGLGAKIMNALFGPLASATGGDQAGKLIDRLLDGLDAAATWVESHGPTIMAFFEGFAGGLKLVWKVIQWVIAPVRLLMKVLHLIDATGSSTGLGRTVGYIIAASIAFKLLGAGLMLLLGPLPMIFVLLGALELLGRALPVLVGQGVISATVAGRIGAVLSPLVRTVRVFAVLTGGWHGALLGLHMAGQRLLSGFLMPLIAGFGRFMRLMRMGNGISGFFNALRGGFAFASRFGWMSRIGTFIAWLLPRIAQLIAGISNPIGWVVLAVTTLATVGTLLYRNFTPFRNLVDSIWDTLKGWGSSLGDSFKDAAKSAVDWFMSIPDKLGGLGAAIYDFIFPQWIRDALSKIGITLPGGATVGAVIGSTVGSMGAATVGGNDPFIQGVNGVAGRLGISGEDLLKVMNFESGLKANAVNGASGATGLIQFMPGTASELGTSTAALRNMSAADQLPFVERYLKMHGVKPGMGLEQLYMSILAGNAGKSGALWRTGSAEYQQNAGLDVDKDGIITSKEAVAKVQNAWTAAAPQINQHFHITGAVNPQAVTDMSLQTQLSIQQGFSTNALEQGYGGVQQ